MSSIYVCVIASICPYTAMCPYVCLPLLYIPFVHFYDCLSIYVSLCMSIFMQIYYMYSCLSVWLSSLCRRCAHHRRCSRRVVIVSSMSSSSSSSSSLCCVVVILVIVIVVIVVLLSSSLSCCCRRVVVVIVHIIVVVVMSSLFVRLSHIGILSTVDTTQHIRNFYRATHMHSADYTVATCLSDHSFPLSIRLSVVYHTTGLPPCTHEFLSSFCICIPVHLPIHHIHTHNVLSVFVTFVRHPLNTYLSVSLSFACLDMRTYSYASVTFTNNFIAQTSYGGCSGLVGRVSDS